MLIAAALPAALAEALPTVAEIETGIGLPENNRRGEAQPMPRIGTDCGERD